MVAAEIKDSFDPKNKDHLSLILFLETRVVDFGGRVDVRHMNKEDMVLARTWNDTALIQFGRLAAEHLVSPDLPGTVVKRRGTHWCQFSSRAWALAHAERKARAGRMWKARKWKTTMEIA